MSLRWKVLLGSLAVAVPVALLAWTSMDGVRERDQQRAVERVVLSLVNEQLRERCESDPGWFLTGPLEGRPQQGVFFNSNPDALAPRPRAIEQPFELFAYDDQFLGSSPAAPRFPPEFRNTLRTSATQAMAPFVTDEGAGVQMAVSTGWFGGPCAYLLGRLAPLPDRRSVAIRFILGGLLVALIAGLAAAAPVVVRVRRLARDARASVREGYTTIAPDRRKDELSAVAFAFNDATTELRLRKTRIDDVEAAIRRFVQSTDEELTEPFRELERLLGTAVCSAGDSDAAHALGRAFSESHDLSARSENLVAAARLRMRGAEAAQPIDVAALVVRVIERHQPLANVAGVSIESSLPQGAVTIRGHERMLERAIANVVDNAIRYNTRGGTVSVTLDRSEADGRFRLAVADTGPGVSDDDFRKLTVIRRFRGDEDRNRRAGGPGLGLAVTREVVDRAGLQFDLRRREGGGLEAAFSGSYR